MNPVIIVMTKAPVAGAVKTRLTPFLTAEQAADLARCFAVDVFAKILKICPRGVVAFAGEKNLLTKLLPENLFWIRQEGADLGERMHNALCFAFQNNFSPLVVVGTDSPTLPPEFIAEAVKVLSGNLADVVLGETDDGGYYLIGLNQPNPRIFQNVRWSSPETFADTARNIERLNLRLKALSVWYDVDAPEDLQRLKKEIENNPNARELAPATTRWFEENRFIFRRQTSFS